MAVTPESPRKRAGKARRATGWSALVTDLMASLLSGGGPAPASPSPARPAARAGRRSRHSTAEWLELGRGLAEQDAVELAEERQAAAQAAMQAALDAAFDVSALVADARPRAVESGDRAVGVTVTKHADRASADTAPRHPGGSAARRLLLLAGLLVPAVGARTAAAQDVKIRELTIAEGSTPVRLVGYGLAVGLDGSGDRNVGGKASNQTVQSVVNLLRRFNVEVPAEVMRTRNVAAVLVTAEVSPYLRAGGKFEISVSSMGDARSLRGGVLWMTPLVADAGGQPVATAQGALLISDGGDQRIRNTIETTARIPAGGLLEGELPRPAFASANRLLLREPDVGTASRIAAAINTALGPNSAKVEDPGSIALTMADTSDRATLMSRIRDLAVRPDRPARIIIDGRDGTVVAGGELTVGEAVVSHGAVTLTIGGPDAPPPPGAGAAPAPAGDVRVVPGTSVQRIAAALHAVQTPPAEIAAIFGALRDVGAISADVVVR
jgi:flagellar P-ring protein precursor FlgI